MLKFIKINSNNLNNKEHKAQIDPLCIFIIIYLIYKQKKMISQSLIMLPHLHNNKLFCIHNKIKKISIKLIFNNNS